MTCSADRPEIHSNGFTTAADIGTGLPEQQYWKGEIMDIVIVVSVLSLAYLVNYRVGNPDWNPIRLGHMVRLNKKHRA
jgi:hypothetical protein